MKKWNPGTWPLFVLLLDRHYIATIYNLKHPSWLPVWGLEPLKQLCVMKCRDLGLSEIIIDFLIDRTIFLENKKCRKGSVLLPKYLYAQCVLPNWMKQFLLSEICGSNFVIERNLKRSWYCSLQLCTKYYLTKNRWWCLLSFWWSAQSLLPKTKCPVQVLVLAICLLFINTERVCLNTNNTEMMITCHIYHSFGMVITV